MYRDGSNRAIDAPYTVYYNGGSQTVDVNQTSGGGAWVLLGTYYFQSGTAGYVNLGNGPAEGSKVVVADAVRFLPTGGGPTNTPTNTPTSTPTPATTPVERIIDDGDSGYTKSGTWTYATGTAGTCYNGDYDYCTSVSTSPTKWAQWTPNLTAAGSYKVYVMYRSGSNRCSDAPYTVYYNGGSQTVDVNQTLNGGTWVLLGTYNFAAGTSGYVRLNNGPAVKSKAIVADAVKFTPN